MKSAGFHTDFMKSAGFHTDFMKSAGFSYGFHEIRRISCEIERPLQGIVTLCFCALKQSINPNSFIPHCNLVSCLCRLVIHNSSALLLTFLTPLFV